MKNLANFITLLRIPLAVILLFIKPFSVIFIIIYLACALTDALDGYVARRTKTASRLGEKLDSISDIIMFIVFIVIFYPIILPSKLICIWIVCIFTIRIVSMLIGFFKFKAFSMLHTYANKVAGFIIICIPVIYSVFPYKAVLYIVCMITVISAIEELIIIITKDKLNRNIKGIWD